MSRRNQSPPPSSREGTAESVLDVRLRPLTVDDISAVHRIETAATADPWSEALFRDELSPEGPPRRWLVAFEGRAAGDDDEHEEPGEIVGFGGVLFLVDEAHIMNIAVSPKRQRRGVAAQLLAALLLHAGDRGAIHATLEVRSSNTAAVALYERFGFETAGRRPRYYADGEDASIMWAHRIDRAGYRDGLQNALTERGAPIDG